MLRAAQITLNGAFRAMRTFAEGNPERMPRAAQICSAGDRCEAIPRAFRFSLPVRSIRLLERFDYLLGKCLRLVGRDRICSHNEIKCFRLGYETGRLRSQCEVRWDCLRRAA